MSESHFPKDLFYQKLESLLSLPAGSVKGPMLLKDIKSWDSLAILEFIVAADTDYSSDVEPADISACQTVDDLAILTFAHSKLTNEGVHTGN